MIWNLAQTAATAVTVLGGTLLGAPTALALRLFGEEQPDIVMRAWGWSILRAAGVSVQTRGLENLPSGHCVLVCNHQSLFDVPVILTEIRRHVRFVAKAELFKIPVFGQALSGLDMVKVQRDGGHRDRQALEGEVPKVRDRVDVLFFPEGTRSEDGSLGRFKKGAAVLAIQAGVPVVPMAISGTMEILPKGSPFIHAGRHAALVVGEPISTAGKAFEDREAVTEICHTAVQRLLDEAKAMVARA